MNDFFIADEERIITPEYTGNDNDIETSLRPHALDEYVGQEKAKENLKIYIEAAKMRGESLDHVLLYGPPGLGKTTLSGIIANEMGVNFRVTSGPAIEKPGDLAALLTNLNEGDVLFIDEIHTLVGAGGAEGGSPGIHPPGGKRALRSGEKLWGERDRLCAAGLEHFRRLLDNNVCGE